MKKAFLTLGLWIIPFLIYAQNQIKIDSLEKQLSQSSKGDSAYFQTIEALTDQLLMFFPKKSRDLAHEAFSLAQQSSLLPHQAKALKQIGLSYYYEQSPDSSRLFLERALSLYQSLQDTLGIAAVLHNIGLNYYTEGNYTQCLDYYIQSIRMEESIGHTSGLIPSYANVAMVLEAQQQYSQALEYYQKALQLAEENQHIVAKIQVAFNMARLYYMNKDMDQALIFADSSLAISKQIQMPFGIGKSSGIRADVLLAQNKPQEALESVLLAEDIFMQMSSPVDLFNLGIIKANIYEKLGDYPKMEDAVQKAAAINKQAPNFENSKKVYYALYKAYKGMNKNEQGLQAFEKYMQYKDSSFTLEKDAKINELMTKYETAKKEQEIQSLQQQSQIQQLELQQKNNLIAIGGFSAILLAIISYLFYQRKQLQQQRTSLKIEQRLLRSQLNPHFIFNALNAIQDFILSQNAQEGGIYLAQFAKLMRGILESSREEFISLDKETEMLESYLSLQQIRFNHRFNYQVEVDEELDIEEVTIPPMFAQPFLENAIEHGLASLPAQGHIQLRFQKVNDKVLTMSITDNGVGINTPQPRDAKHQSLATKITQERIDAFQKSMGREIRFEIQSPEQGTQVLFYLPYGYI